MTIDVSSVLFFILLYFLFNALQYLISLIDASVEVLTSKMALYIAKLQIEIQEGKESTEEESSNCIGFQYEPPVIEEDEEDD